MSRYLILAQSEVTANALGTWLELLGEVRPDIDDKRRIVWQESVVGVTEERWVLAYENLAKRFEDGATDALGLIPLNKVVVLVDSLKPNDINPLNDIGGWENLVAMLILTFPEIRWVFGVLGNDLPRFMSKNHSLSSLISNPWRDPLLDATGLRNFVRDRINSELSDSLIKAMTTIGRVIDEPQKKVLKKSLLPIRGRAAASIDEEANYALFHAYVAYRFGYRADAVRSWALMDQLFGKEAATAKEQEEKHENKGHGFDLLLEDVNLNFPDKLGEIHLSTFAPKGTEGKDGRATTCPLLGANEQNETSEFRIIVTSGHSGTDADKMVANQKFVANYKGKDKTGYVLKPVGGMFDLWEAAKLFTRLNPHRGNNLAGRFRGQAPGFYWPPIPSEKAEEAGGHSAPGKLMLVAQHLVRRADALRATANTVEECIRGAVLATDALELLRYQTPTLALQALSLKHEFEVKAEVAFLGVGHHFDFKKRRLKELEYEVKEASRFFEGKRRRAAELDSLVSIGNRLMLVFREAGQFDEEMECLVRIRTWHRQLRRKQTRKILDHLANGVMGYAEWLLVSPKRFFGMLCVWFLGLWVVWIVCGLMGWWAQAEGVSLIVGSLSAAWNSFAVANPNDAHNAADLALNIVGSAAGVFHLGVFISYLYSAVSRK